MQLNKDNLRIKRYRFALYISILMIGTYGLLPYFLSRILVYRDIPWAQINLEYSIYLVIALLFWRNPSKRRLKMIDVLPVNGMSYLTILTLFTGLVIIFYIYPWHEDRTSIGASVAAMCRATWLYVVFSTVNMSAEYKRYLILILTVCLMMVDQSRTYFLVMLLFLTARLTHRWLLFSIATVLMMILAALRMDKYSDIVQSVYYGVFGEVYNATIVVGQVARLENIWNFEPTHILGVLSQPLTYFIKLLGILEPTNTFFSLNTVIEAQLGEKAAPMGGWYIITDFVHLGLVGVIIMFIYLAVMIFFTRSLFYHPHHHNYMYFIPILIKSSPFIYVNFLLYIWVIFFVLKRFFSLRFK